MLACFQLNSYTNSEVDISTISDEEDSNVWY
jgi:hypothetical protein